jgi:hypothetical protein
MKFSRHLTYLAEPFITHLLFAAVKVSLNQPMFQPPHPRPPLRRSVLFGLTFGISCPGDLSRTETIQINTKYPVEYNGLTRRFHSCHARVYLSLLPFVRRFGRKALQWSNAAMRTSTSNASTSNALTLKRLKVGCLAGGERRSQ